MTQLNEGEKAPYFKGQNQDGKEITLDDFKGKRLILYFYPKDNTSGCTAEACSLNEGYASLTSQGFEVIGVSPDPASSHQKFIAKYNLSIQPDCRYGQTIMETYGSMGREKNVWEKLYGGCSVPPSLSAKTAYREDNHQG